MTSRVFISYRSSDGADKATALARDLDEMFGEEQIFLDKEDLAAGSRWRDDISKTFHDGLVLLVLVTPAYLGAVDSAGRRCIDRSDDPVRAELQAALAAGAHIVPILCDGVAGTPAAADLPAPFDQLAERTWRRLRAYDWREDLARLAGDLRALGIVPRSPAAAAPASAGSAGVLAGNAGSSSTRRRLVLAGAGLAVLAAAAWYALRPHAVDLSGRWRLSVGARGSKSSRDGEIVIITIAQQGSRLQFSSSAVDIERNADWQNYRDYWKQRFGSELKRVFYRGEGEIGYGGAAGEPLPPDVPEGPQRIVVAVRIDGPDGGEPIDRGSLRGVVDPDEQRIRARLWLNSEQAERAVDLRREPRS